MSETPGVFDDCRICILQTKDLSASAADLLAGLVKDGRGTLVRLEKDGTIPLLEVDYIVSETIDFPQYTEARDAVVSVVKSSWVQDSFRRRKLAQIKSHSPDPRLIFSGVNFAFGDNIPEPDRIAIAGAALAMGGQFSENLTKMVTHLVALSMNDPVCQHATEKGLKCKIVLPHWFDDCFKLGCKIDESPYLLPDPEIGRLKSEDLVNFPDTPQVADAVSANPDSPPLGNRKLQVFIGKKIKLSEQLELPQTHLAMLRKLIRSNEGILVESVYDADIYVCQYRSGKDYIIASRTNKDVGNLAWLYFLITHDEWTSPFKRLLHYPTPENGIPGFKGLLITMSNYGGEARTYLENVIKATGATFTKNMKQENTHLVTARQSSDKCEAALDWNIPMINHLWIEDSYVKCEMQALTYPRYTTFPPRTNLAEVVGRIQLNKKILEEKYYPERLLPPVDRQRVKAMTNKDTNTPAAKTPASRKRKSELDDDAQITNSRETKTPASKKRKSELDGAPDDAQIDSARPRKRISSAFTPDSVRMMDKENATPSSTSSRGAKDRALSRLHDLAPDMALYEKEKKRNSGIWGGKQAADRSEREMEAIRKRISASPMLTDETGGSEEPDTRKRAGTLPEVQMRLLITGYRRWTDDSEHATKQSAETKKLRNLGILITKEPASCTHLAAPQVVKTQKFLTALAYGPITVSTDFIDKCLEKNKVVNVDDFLLENKKDKQANGIQLKDALARARKNGRRLLAGVAIYCTDKIVNGPAQYQKVVEANGGTFVEYNGRHQTIKKPTAESQDKDERESVYLLSTTKPEEQKLWPKFREMAISGAMNPKIVDKEWLLATALSQKLGHDKEFLIKDAN